MALPGLALRAAHIERIRAALEPRAEVLEAYLFGSFARGETHAESDLDVAVYVDPSRCEPAALDLRLELADLLSLATRAADVDVVVLNDASPLLYHRVLREGVRILSRDLVATTRREAEAVSRYCDFQPTLALLRALARRRLERGEYGR